MTHCCGVICLSAGRDKFSLCGLKFEVYFDPLVSDCGSFISHTLLSDKPLEINNLIFREVVEEQIQFMSHCNVSEIKHKIFRQSDGSQT